ncbi:MAG: TonB family protein [Thermodesulfovibrionales bacterium]
MNSQLRGFTFSLVIHMSVLLVIIGLSSSMVRLGKPVVIDFSIENSLVKHDSTTLPAPKSESLKARETELRKPKTVAAKQEPAPQQVTAISETVAESQAPVSAKPSASVQPVSGSPLSTANVEKAEGRESPFHGQGNPVEGMKQSYLKEHFAYIRNIVQKKLSYPTIARKMGWEGRVIISFIVCPDGHAKDITIKEGSGIELLDKNAIAAVRQASPFPKPPVEAQLIIPINYSLN